jgi:TolB-like protein/AraC-like DNA-binding protein
MKLAVSDDESFIRRLDELIEANLTDENFGVKELVNKSGLNERFIRRKLKNIAKKTISQYITGKRLERAFEMLQQDEINVSEVAFGTGFNSPTYFNAVFHQHFGFPPGEVKKRNILNYQSESVAAESIVPSALPFTDKRSGIKLFLRKYKIPLILTGSLALILFLVWIFRFTPVSHDKSIIVLPFKDYSADAGNNQFADGITEDILDKLSKISDLKVRSRTTSDHFRGTTLTMNEIAREVKARNVLEGSVRKEGNRVRISVQLIDAYEDRHIWAENYDRELENVLGIQGEIALQVAAKLKAVLSENEKGRIEAIPTRSLQAYDFYRRGRFLINKASGNQRADLNKEGLMNSIKYFETAVAADSSFALAYAGLAEAWFTLSAWGWYRPYMEGLLKAKKYAEKALQIDPNCAEAHQLKASWLIWPERKFEEGRMEFENTLRLNPNFPGAHQNYAQFLMITGPISESRKHMDRAIELDPYFWVAWNLNAWIYYFEEKYDKAIEACQMARDLNGNYWETDWLFFLNYTRTGNGEKAAEELQRLFHRYPGTEPYLEEIKNAAKKSGAPGLYHWLIDFNLNHPINTEGLNGHPYFLGWWYALIGDKEKSLYWLEKNMSEKNKWIVYFDLIATNPDFDILRNDPRFLSIIDRQGLTPYHRRKAK